MYLCWLPPLLLEQCHGFVTFVLLANARKNSFGVYMNLKGSLVSQRKKNSYGNRFARPHV